jgi:stress response protein YsnF
VQIERRRIDQPVPYEEPPGTRTEGDTTIFPILEEIVVVEKRLILREEIRVTRIRQERPSSQEIAVKREQLHVERLPAVRPNHQAGTPIPVNQTNRSEINDTERRRSI